VLFFFVKSETGSAAKIILEKVLYRKNLLNAKHITLLLLLFIFQGYTQPGQLSDSAGLNKSYSSKLEFGAEYLVPTRFSNKIETISFSAFFWKKHFKSISVMFNVGVISTFGWGNIVQTKEISETIIDVTSYKSSAFGLGPALQTQFAPIQIKRFSLVLEVNGGFILYTNRFPYGGDVYNFMFRTGPSLTYRIKNNSFIKIGYRWMHVSNGKGYGPQNPFYEAQGVNVSCILAK
jgi:lipid A 3-O-deacylase